MPRTIPQRALLTSLAAVSVLVSLVPGPAIAEQVSDEPVFTTQVEPEVTIYDPFGNVPETAVPEAPPAVAPAMPQGATAGVPAADADGEGPQAPSVPAGGSELADRYASLSGALISAYATNAGSSLPAFLASNGEQLGSQLALPQLSSMRTATLPELNTSLTASGLTLGTAAGSDLAARVFGTSNPDALVTAAATTWAAELAALRAPALGTPSLPGVDTSIATSMPAEGLAFGMFTNRTITALIADHPDVFAEVSRTGLNNPASQQAWRSSMMNALGSVERDLSSVMPNPCGSAFMTALASGSSSAANASAPGCGGCVAAGLYANSHLDRLFNRESNSTLPNPTDTLIPPSEWANLQPWQQQALVAQNPGLSAGVSSAPALGCSSSNAETSGTLQSTLPGVFGNLGR